jgi:2-polyprenyl-3-methyl-5-hydroxy-6-metoxy-1,4-benzoquinol methylase
MAHARDAYASVRAGYAAEGATAYYERHGAAYRNPHEPAVARLIRQLAGDGLLDGSRVLDLAAGSGEVTLALGGVAGHVDGVDPYTAAAYRARTGRPCEEMSFADVAAGSLAGRSYSLVVCSFALHLAEPSRLPAVCWQLAQAAGQLLVLTPHKRPAIREDWGWRLTHERVGERVRARVYARSP